MSSKTSITLVWILVGLCYIVPYLLLGSVNAWYGSFLFFCLVGLAVIALNIHATRKFDRDDRK